MISKEKLLQLVAKQIVLDDFIVKTKQIVVNDDILNKKLIAFLVEIGEYANEERSFKYWANKKEATLEVQLDEYIDCLHFILSIGNHIEFNFSKFEFREYGAKTNIEAYFNILDSFNGFAKDKTNNKYQKMLNAFLEIITIKNYSEIEIDQAYNLKNEINFTRQEENY